MVDFLTDPDASYFSPKNATGNLKQIFEATPFQTIWTELSAFVQTEHRHLTIVLGNHDLELALPWVRAYLIETLGGTNEAAKGRVNLCFDGAGFACSVGGSRVLCLHGNEVDTWNVTDHEMLRRLGRDLVQGREVPQWTPNAGTKLVIDVINPLKRMYAFVDLLKPEIRAVVPIVLALDQNAESRLNNVLGVARRLTWDSVRRAAGFLSVDEAAIPTALSGEPLESLAGRQGWPRPSADAASAALLQHADTTQLMLATEEAFRAGVDPLMLVHNGMLGLGDTLRKWVRSSEKYELLWRALKGLADDQSFDPKVPDEPFERIDRYVGSDFEWVITGHTHLERVLPRTHGRGKYINTGTWIPLIRLTPDFLRDAPAFKPVYDVMATSRQIPDLERVPGLLLRKPAVASIIRDGSGVSGKLERVTLDTNGNIGFQMIG
jgi:hypothetical protein